MIFIISITSIETRDFKANMSARVGTASTDTQVTLFSYMHQEFANSVPGFYNR